MSLDIWVLKLGGLVLLGGGCYALGNVHATRWALEHQQAADAAHEKASVGLQQLIDAGPIKITPQAAILESDNATEKNKEKIYVYLPRPQPRPELELAAAADAGALRPCIPRGFVLLYNSTAAGLEAPANPVGDATAPSCVDTDTATSVALDNLGECRRDMLALKAWQDFYDGLPQAVKQ